MIMVIMIDLDEVKDGGGLVVVVIGLHIPHHMAAISP